MNLQPGNEDWCNPRTHGRQQTKHKEINARKPYTWKSTYPFPDAGIWSQPGKTQCICSFLLQNHLREKANFCSVNQADNSKHPLNVLHMFLLPPATQSANHLYRLHMKLCACVCVYKHSHSMWVYTPIYTSYIYMYIKIKLS